MVKNGDTPLTPTPGRHIVTFSVKDLIYQAKETGRLWVALCRTDRLGEMICVLCIKPN